MEIKCKLLTSSFSEPLCTGNLSGCWGYSHDQGEQGPVRLKAETSKSPVNKQMDEQAIADSDACCEGRKSADGGEGAQRG